MFRWFFILICLLMVLNFAWNTYGCREMYVEKEDMDCWEQTVLDPTVMDIGTYTFCKDKNESVTKGD